MTLDLNSLLTRKMLMVALVMIGLYGAVTHFLGNKGLELPIPSVVTQLPVKAIRSDYVTQTGTMVAYNAVDLVARIEGYLTQIEFEDGSLVKKGQELFVIEPEPYMEQLKAAEAKVKAQQAIAQYDKIEYERQKRMYKENATSLNNVEKWLAKSHESEAEVAKTVADAQMAAINYSYTHVQSPFDGRIGRHLVDTGNLVGNGTATNLATVEQIDPIYAYFNLSELDLIRVRQAAAKMGMQPKDVKEVSVYVAMQNETGFPHEGKLDFVNTGLNASTGTMEFRALLPNKNYLLLPGMFVQVRVAITKPTEQLTVPDTAVQYDQIGAYLLLVDTNHKVQSRRVQIGGVEEGMRAITQGLELQDQVIVDGLQNAIPGNEVKPVLAQESFLAGEKTS